MKGKAIKDPKSYPCMPSGYQYRGTVRRMLMKE